MAGFQLTLHGRIWVTPEAFGHNFGALRIHAGERDARSARAVRAQVYTFGPLDQIRLEVHRTMGKLNRSFDRLGARSLDGT